MNRLIFILFSVFLLSGCGSRHEKMTTMASDNAASFSPDQITKVVGIGKVEPEGEIVQLASPTGGIVAELYRNEGNNVKEGEPYIIKPEAMIRTAIKFMQYDKVKNFGVQIGIVISIFLIGQQAGILSFLTSLMGGVISKHRHSC